MFGLIRKTLVFSTGTVFGVYLAQNYRLPDVGSVAGALYKKASNDDPKK